MTRNRPKDAEPAVLVRALLEPRAYAHRPETVELRQTHISWVFLAGELVFKVKKPVRFSFLDYSTLAKRLYFCREEVRLNRRLAPEVYHGAVPILGRGAEARVCPDRQGEGDWPVVDYAVKMRRLPADRMLDALVRDGKAGSDDLQAVARRLAAFHREASAIAAREYGSPEAVRRMALENLDEITPFVGDTVRASEWAELDAFVRELTGSRRRLFADRLREGRVREGHGDLRAEHVCLTEGIDIFDCVEFSERFRTGDIASEIAFLAMDLEFLGDPLLARKLVGEYAQASGDERLSELLPFYGCYRACVRAKVESLKSREDEVPERERIRARIEARRHVRLALRYVRPAVRRALILVCGPAGTGKSTIARQIAAETGFLMVHSDVVRKRLARLSPTERVPLADRERIYGGPFSWRTYQRLHAEARELLARGEGVVVDATFLEPSHRRRFLELGGEAGVPVLVVECRASEAEVLRRLERRRDDRLETSDADRAVYLDQKRRFRPVAEVPADRRIIAETDGDLDSAVDAVRRALPA